MKLLARRSALLAALATVVGVAIPQVPGPPAGLTMMANVRYDSWQGLVDQVVGFGENTTGGLSGTLCEVTNLNDSGAGSLRACAETAEARWITFTVDGTITGLTPILIQSNKTVDGRGADITFTGCAQFEFGEWNTRPNPVSNVIIHNLKFEDGTCNGFIIIAEDASDIWIDHNTFHDAVDEIIGITSNGNDGSVGAAPQGITISWNHMPPTTGGGPPGGGISPDWDDKSILVSDPSLPVDADVTITAHHNHYETYVRHPLGRWAKFHAFNNYYDRVNIGVDAVSELRFYSENEIFERWTGGGGATVLVKVWVGGIPGFDTTGALNVKVTGALMLAGATYEEIAPETIFNPASFYTYTADTADETLRLAIIAGAGWQP